MRVAALVAAMSLTGCATIVAGGPDEFPVVTHPPGAYVYVDGKIVGQTPTVVTLDRNKNIGDIRIYYPGFKSLQVQRYKTFNWWVLGNFFLAMFPAIVDFVTGDWQEFDDSGIDLDLIPGNSVPPYGVQPGAAPQRGPLPSGPAPEEPHPPGPVH